MPSDWNLSKKRKLVDNEVEPGDLVKHTTGVDDLF
jgi:hypothetical protein